MQFEKLITNKPESSFYHELKQSLAICDGYDLSVAFITYSGLQTIINELTTLSNKGIRGRIITTNYMFGTDPKALEKLLTIPNLEVRVYDAFAKGAGGFHTKGYIFKNNGIYKVIVGSSNLTTSALKTNKEWNILLSGDRQVDTIFYEYNYLWDLSLPLTSEFIKEYDKKYINSKKNVDNDLFNKIVTFVKQTNEHKFINDLASFFEIDEKEILNEIENKNITINPMQEKAVERLEELRQRNENKALVIAATGTGKTYLAAFDVLNVNPRRMLFIAHRERILREAKGSFQNIIFDKKMGVLTGTSKDSDVEYLFATNHMAAKLINDKKYSKDYFDYIIIDEAHRASGNTYKDIIDCFEPKFLLGLTATPERTDASSIFEIFDNNIALEIRLRDALDSQLIVPFHYFGINDIATDINDTDLKDITKLTKKLSINRRVELIIENIKLYGNDGKKTKALGFCVSKEHAKYMSEEFNRLGYPSVYLTGEDSDDKRELALKRLENEADPLSYIFTVDIFNEGVDIPSVNLVLMLRPTESPIIFTQQLGRGLRKHKDKEFLTVLDFIGNNKSSFLMAMALSGDKAKDKDDLKEAIKNDFFDIKGDTFITLDRESKEIILKQLEKTNLYTLDYFKRIYYEIENRLKNTNKELLYLELEDLDLNGFDPTKIIAKYGYYFKFLRSIKNDQVINEVASDEDYSRLLKFIDDQLPLKQSVNYYILKIMIEEKELPISTLYSKIYEVTKVGEETLNYALSYLMGDYMDQTDMKRYHKLINVKDKIVSLSTEFKRALENNTFNKYVRNTINYGLLRYKREFDSLENKGLELYIQYSRKEIAFIKSYEKKNSGFANSTGLFEYNNEFFLFVNLNKENVRESIDYKDEFIDTDTFQWESPGSTKQSSSVGQKLIRHKELGINLHLFVRKNEVEDGITQKFTYFGLIDVKDYKNETPIRFTMKFKNRVPEDIYSRFLIERNIER